MTLVLDVSFNDHQQQGQNDSKNVTESSRNRSKDRHVAASSSKAAKMKNKVRSFFFQHFGFYVALFGEHRFSKQSSRHQM